MRIQRAIPYVLGAALAGVLPLLTGAYLEQVAGSTMIYLTLALSWDMLLRSGQLGFGTHGFFGLGSYAAVLLFLETDIHPFLSIAFGGLVAGAVATLIGLAVLRLRGMYFAITTLALASIFSVVLRNLPQVSGGPEGKMLPSCIYAGDTTKVYWLILGLALLTIVVSEVFERTRIHLALTSIRNDERVAKTSGVNVFWYLVFVFAVTSAIQGIAGGTYAHVFGFVSPEGSFSANFLLLPLAMALLGGIHSTWGPVLGGLVLGALSEYLKLQIPYGHLLVYGAIIVIVTLFLPQGIRGMLRAAMRRVPSARGEKP
ncbi:MAG: branched-chain amino acid ABC transporter permease [Candidatus Bipolaricaulota bacterium]